MELELQDVINHTETPLTSDDEDPEAPILNPPRMPHIAELLSNMLAAVSTLSRNTTYSELYDNRQYLKNISKKMKKMKKNAKSANFEKIYEDERFWEELNTIQQTYPDDGGRPFLNHLVALETYLRVQSFAEYDTDTESENEDNSEPEVPAKKFFKKDDDDHQGGGQMIFVQ